MGFLQLSGARKSGSTWKGVQRRRHAEVHQSMGWYGLKDALYAKSIEGEMKG